MPEMKHWTHRAAERFVELVPQMSSKKENEPIVQFNKPNLSIRFGADEKGEGRFAYIHTGNPNESEPVYTVKEGEEITGPFPVLANDSGAMEFMVDGIDKVFKQLRFEE